MSISRLVTEWLLPALICPCCGQVITADAPPGARPGSICYAPGINTAAVLLDEQTFDALDDQHRRLAARVEALEAAVAVLEGLLLGSPIAPGAAAVNRPGAPGRPHAAGTTRAGRWRPMSAVWVCGQGGVMVRADAIIVLACAAAAWTPSA